MIILYSFIEHLIQHSSRKNIINGRAKLSISSEFVINRHFRGKARTAKNISGKSGDCYSCTKQQTNHFSIVDTVFMNKIITSEVMTFFIFYMEISKMSPSFSKKISAMNKIQSEKLNRSVF